MPSFDPQDDALRRVQEMERMLRHLAHLTRLRDALRGLDADAIKPHTLQTLDRYIEEESARMNVVASELHRSWSRVGPRPNPRRST
jgi:hypothetical protein